MAHLDQTLTAELCDRFPDRRKADAKLNGQYAQGFQTLARSHIARQNLTPNEPRRAHRQRLPLEGRQPEAPRAPCLAWRGWPPTLPPAPPLHRQPPYLVFR
jgi:hypothetical protein